MAGPLLGRLQDVIVYVERGTHASDAYASRIRCQDTGVNAHPLDNPIWEALHTHHARFASGDRGAARYAAEVAPFAAVGDADPESSAELARLLAPAEHLYGVGPAPATSRLLQIEHHGPLAQMVWTAPFPAPSAAKVIPLTAVHLPDMLELTALVYPAYFRPRTLEMGRYFGSMTDRDSPRWRASGCTRIVARGERGVYTPGLPGARSRAAVDGGDLRKHPPARRNAFPARHLRQRAREDPL